MNRKNFIKTTGISLAGLLFSNSVFAKDPEKSFISFPDAVTAIVNNQLIKLIGKKQLWSCKDLKVHLKETASGIAVEIESPHSDLSAVTLHWNQKSDGIILNDAWERTYGDVSWHKAIETEILPWYFIEHNSKGTHGFGVKTGAASFCSWMVNSTELSLTMDTLSGGNGVVLGNRKLLTAEIVTITSHTGESVFDTTRRFIRKMCDKPRMPATNIYGINDWYFSYGNNSEKLIIEHTKIMAPMADGLLNRPFSVIDAGWFIGPPSQPDDCCWGDGMDTANKKFGDMSRVAEEIKTIGMRPGIWTRPLCGKSTDTASLSLPLIKGREANKPVLDPTIPENIERIKNYFKLYKQQGYELVKFDFTTYDIFGKWGFEMLRDKTITSANWHMYDNSKTNAEIISGLYKAIRESAGDTYIISCNTISHLSAGVFEMNRIGDDTSGNEWDRTRKMGVNTLAFRGVQHGLFYAADPDCVGLTDKISWERNKQWMELIAKSGLPLFISAQPGTIGKEQKETIKECFLLSSQNIPVGEPLDWMQTAYPQRWKLNGNIEKFNWA